MISESLHFLFNDADKNNQRRKEKRKLKNQNVDGL